MEKKVAIKKSPLPKQTPGEVVISYENYKARYKVIQSIYGNYTNKTIEFSRNDHNGIPAFSKTKYALLFVFKHNGQFHHIRYQYFDVYKTTNGRWASCGDPFYFDVKYKDSVKTSIPVIKLAFLKPVILKIDSSWDNATKKQVFPEPYYKIEGLSATGLMGSYVENLFIVKKEGILKQLGYFK